MAATVAAPPGPALTFDKPPTSEMVYAVREDQTESPTYTPPETASTPQAPLDLNSEVTVLSNKLVNAINFQTNLDDSLAAARHELEGCKERIRQLEAENAEYRDKITSGILVRREDVEAENAELRESLERAKHQRAAVEREKKAIELELENLTTALFEEANEMVAAARHERDQIDRKNEQLRTQLKDTENLLASHQEQLAELKSVMQQMSSDREEADTNTSTAPTTPLLGNHESLGRVTDALHIYPNTGASEDVSPSYPTSFSYLMQPVVRTDLQAYQDFTALLRMPRTGCSRARASTASYSGLSMVGLGSLSHHSPSDSSTPSPSTGSPPPPPSGSALASTPATPSTPAPTVTNGSSKDSIPLKDTRFYKKVLTEDIEPTLRLDCAPALSWLARRNVVTSMSEGNLVVEPMPATPSLKVVSCSLCGERRRGDEYSRTHRFKTNDTENAQGYPLCSYCTSRVRATCDFLGFLRMVKDGHWRAEGGDGEKSAWEESVKLRERMFWARIGGGVVPAFLQMKNSPRSSSVDERAEKARRISKVLSEGESEEGKDGTAKTKDDDVFHSNEKRVSIGKAVISVDGAQHSSGDQAEEEKSISDLKGPGQSSEAASDHKLSNAHNLASTETPDSELRSIDPKSPVGLSAPAGFSAGRNEQRLSITIPGAF